MDRALEEIEFLALSANRVAVLETLREHPCTRRELAERTDASQPTLGRVLRDLTERHWVTHDGERYTTTATGEMVAAEFTDLRETLETELRLREVMAWLPTDTMTFDLRRLRDATITRPSQTRPDAPVQRALELLWDANEVRIFSHAFNGRSLDVLQRRIADHEGRFEGVFSPAAVEALADDAPLRRQLQDLLAADDAEVRLYDGSIPVAVTLADDVVHLMLRDEGGLLRAGIDTDDEAAVAWARETHAAYWEHATPLDLDALD
ncbi:winged helix-turn-helix domain-containing protein [Halococcus sp. IIIV-5B]|uniref:helix-turn-helix transcriptional regulator n=1 Tax=Halococcus sp. IIIV-5B TaxID=2321230 RepID=UPI000E70EC0B|nr:transcriptional regulator FilR1 domain-containing protein [Halococcus sp. IIIV-5B]RJT02221.1 ArsR family transcriptional regulator [Halococcus sp. IIIV-5B]